MAKLKRLRIGRIVTFIEGGVNHECKVLGSVSSAGVIGYSFASKTGGYMIKTHSVIVTRLANSTAVLGKLNKNSVLLQKQTQ